MVTDLRLTADLPQLKILTLMPHSKAYMAAAGIVNANLDALLGIKQLEVCKSPSLGLPFGSDATPISRLEYFLVFSCQAM